MRSSISRAYYAAFCTACNFISHVDHKPLPDDEPIHQYVANYFSGTVHGSKRNNKRAKIGSELKRMKADRVKADYDSSYGNMMSLNATVRDVLMRSERVISLLERVGFEMAEDYKIQAFQLFQRLDLIPQNVLQCPVSSSCLDFSIAVLAILDNSHDPELSLISALIMVLPITLIDSFFLNPQALLPGQNALHPPPLLASRRIQSRERLGQAPQPLILADILLDESLEGIAPAIGK